MREDESLVEFHPSDQRELTKLSHNNDGLRKLDKLGICRGLVTEYFRHRLNHKNDTEKNFIEKLNRKLKLPENGEKDQGNFIKRIDIYQSEQHLHEHKKLQIIPNQKFSTDNITNLTNPGFDNIGLSFSGNKGAHIIAIELDRDANGNISHYRIYDPNYGLWIFKNQESFIEQLNKLQDIYYSSLDASEYDTNFLRIEDMRALIEARGHKKQEENYSKEAKYNDTADPIYEFIKNDDIDGLKTYINEHPETLQTRFSNSNNTILQFLIFNSLNTNMFEFLLKEYIKTQDINSTNIFNETILHVAANYGNLGFIEIILQYIKNHPEALGARFGTFNDTILMLLNNSTNKDVLKALLEEYLKTQDINSTNIFNETILHVAVNHGNLDFIKTILQNAGEHLETILNIQDNNGKTPLQLVIEKQNADAVQAILQNAGEHLENILDIKDKNGMTPLQLAIKNKDTDTIETILQNAGDALRPLLIEQLDDSQKQYILLNAPKNDWVSIVEGILSDGKNLELLNATDENKRTPAHLASIYKGFLDQHIILNTILEKAGDNLGTILKATDKEGNTPLHIAIKNKDTAIVKTILEKAGEHLGTILKATDSKGRTPLHIAIKNKDTAIIKTILEKAGEHLGTILEATDKEGNTPLQAAENAGQTKIVKAISEAIKTLQVPLKNKADINKAAQQQAPMQQPSTTYAR